jgi:hypothetical protein
MHVPDGSSWCTPVALAAIHPVPAARQALFNNMLLIAACTELSALMEYSDFVLVA